MFALFPQNSENICKTNEHRWMISNIWELRHTKTYNTYIHNSLYKIMISAAEVIKCSWEVKEKSKRRKMPNSQYLDPPPWCWGPQWQQQPAWEAKTLRNSIPGLTDAKKHRRDLSYFLLNHSSCKEKNEVKLTVLLNHDIKKL